MMNLESLKEFIRKYQTNKRNIVREYIQNLFLSSLYKIAGSDKLLFKGGTALRLIYLSPRFSEDLDFTGQGIHGHTEIDDLFIGALSELEKTGLNVSYKEAKPTTGGYLGLIHYDNYEESEDMKFEVSLRKGRPMTGELVTVSSEMEPPYIIMQIPPKELISGKMSALLSRKKPRDYYDLYFMLRSQALNKLVDKDKLKAVYKNLASEGADFKADLGSLLPVSHQMLLKDFKGILKRELEKYA